MNTTEVILTKLRRVLSEELSDAVAATARFEVMDIPERFGRRLSAMIDLPLEPLAEFHDTATFRTPKTWFDHFRVRYFPRFLITRFPIKWHTDTQDVVTKVGAVYPKLPLVYPNYGDVIRFHYAGNSPMRTYPIGEPMSNDD